MVLILLSWLYILAISLVIGVTINQIIGLKTYHPIITLFFGFFGVTLMASAWAIPFAIDVTFYVLLFVISIISAYINAKPIIQYIQQFVKGFISLNKLIKRR